MFFPKSALGLEISREGIRFATVRRAKKGATVDGYLFTPLPSDGVRFSHREPNILQPEAFVETLRSAHLRLLTPISRVAVALPDFIGRTMVLDLEARFKSRDEGTDIIRWKLKKSGFQEIQDMQLDYVPLEAKETGEQSVLVSLIARATITQYEDLLNEAGLEPYSIEFTSFSLWRSFCDAVEGSGDFLVCAYYGNILSVFVFTGGTLQFFRSKEIPPGDGEDVRLYQEISNSLLASRERSGVANPSRGYFLASRQQSEKMRAIIAEAASLEPVWLDFRNFMTPAEGVSLDHGTAFALAGSVGAALRGL